MDAQFEIWDEETTKVGNQKSNFWIDIAGTYPYPHDLFATLNGTPNLVFLHFQPLSHNFNLTGRIGLWWYWV